MRSIVSGVLASCLWMLVMSRGVSAQQAGMVTLIVDIQLDDFPTETGWEIINSEREIVKEQPPGSYETSRQVLTEEVEVLSGQTYTFKMQDSGGDGMCCFTPGTYKLSHADDGTVYLEGAGGDFQDVIEVTFEVPFVAAPTTEAPTTMEAPPPADAPVVDEGGNPPVVQNPPSAGARVRGSFFVVGMILSIAFAVN